MNYPAAKDELHPGFTSRREQNLAILTLEERIGVLRATDPASIEDRLYTLENLVVDVLDRLDQPPGQVRN